MKNWLMELGPLAGYIASTLGLCGFVCRLLRKPIQEFEDLRRHTRENWMSLQKLQVWSDELPLAERVDAGEQYVKFGGNGLTKAKHLKNVAELERQVRGNG